MILYIFTILLLLIIAPLLIGMIKSLKMFLLYKKPVSIFQPYATFNKLLIKEVIISHESSIITRIAPLLVLSPLLIVLLFLPPVVHGAYY
ncbi:MAG TPA: hydrogenase, partial [Campylobacterales bacterium]|nr:hydrogenase [Campylobacterales bacterium]